MPHGRAKIYLEGVPTHFSEEVSIWHMKYVNKLRCYYHACVFLISGSAYFPANLHTLCCLPFCRQLNNWILLKRVSVADADSRHGLRFISLLEVLEQYPINMAPLVTKQHTLDFPVNAALAQNELTYLATNVNSVCRGTV